MKNKRAAASAAHDRMPIDDDKNKRRKDQPQEDPYKENQNEINSNTQSDGVDTNLAP